MGAEPAGRGPTTWPRRVRAAVGARWCSWQARRWARRLVVCIVGAVAVHTVTAVFGLPVWAWVNLLFVAAVAVVLSPDVPRRLCGCERCAVTMWPRGPLDAEFLLRSWARRQPGPGPGPDDLAGSTTAATVLVRRRCVDWGARPPAGGHWAGGVLLGWSTWHPGITEVDRETASHLVRAGHASGRGPVEWCEVPDCPDERELLELLARTLSLDAAATSARAALARRSASTVHRPSGRAPVGR